MLPFYNAKIVHTRQIVDALKDNPSFAKDLITSMAKFLRLDWGITSDEDVILNKEALNTKDRVFAVYQTIKGKIWIIAESEDGTEYTVITVLFPREY